MEFLEVVILVVVFVNFDVIIFVDIVMLVLVEEEVLFEWVESGGLFLCFVGF